MFPGFVAAFGFVFLLIVGIYCFGYAARRASLLHELLLETLLGMALIFPLFFLKQGTTPGYKYQYMSQVSFGEWRNIISGG